MVARTQINSVAKSRVFIVRVNELRVGLKTSDRNTVDVISLIAIILVYSAIKIRANSPLLYSTLNPDTSSDSPSAKSNGVRLVSAKLVMNHKIAMMGTKSAVGVD
jgi:hypothetical protein